MYTTNSGLYGLHWSHSAISVYFSRAYCTNKGDIFEAWYILYPVHFLFSKLHDFRRPIEAFVYILYKCIFEIRFARIMRPFEALLHFIQVYVEIRFARTRRPFEASYSFALMDFQIRLVADLSKRGTRTSVFQDQ